MVMREWRASILKSPSGLAYTSHALMPEGYPNGKEAVLKTAERKLLQVRVLSPPLNFTNPCCLARRGLLQAKQPAGLAMQYPPDEFAQPEHQSQCCIVNT